METTVVELKLKKAREKYSAGDKIKCLVTDKIVELQKTSYFSMYENVFKDGHEIRFDSDVVVWNGVKWAEIIKEDDIDYLKEAEKRYPIGTNFISIYANKKCKSTGIFFKQANGSVSTTNGECIYVKDKGWARKLDDLLVEAEKKYPRNTVFNALVGNISTSIVYPLIYDDDYITDSNFNELYSYSNIKWATIIHKPKPKPKTLVDEAIERGFVKGAKFIDLVKKATFTISQTITNDDFNRRASQELYIPVEPHKDYPNKTARAYKDGKWAELVTSEETGKPKIGLYKKGDRVLYRNLEYTIKDLEFNGTKWQYLLTNKYIEELIQFQSIDSTIGAEEENLRPVIDECKFKVESSKKENVKFKVGDYVISNGSTKSSQNLRGHSLKIVGIWSSRIYSEEESYSLEIVGKKGAVSLYASEIMLDTSKTSSKNDDTIILKNKSVNNKKIVVLDDEQTFEVSNKSKSINILITDE